jgi:hypothetical protein
VAVTSHNLQICKVKGMTDSAWLWVVCDAHTKLIPAFTLGSRTQAMAHQLVPEVAHRLVPGCVPVFSNDGLALYFYALTAHFGAWVHNVGERRRAWTVNVQLLSAQVIKRYTCPTTGAGRRRRVAEVCHQVYVGMPKAYQQALCALAAGLGSHSDGVNRAAPPAA